MRQRAAPDRFDYLVIGHITRDIKPDGGFEPGGTAAYAARTAGALGLHAGVITSAQDDPMLFEPLAGIEVLRIPSPATTTFDNRYSPQGRAQVVQAVAALLTPDLIPPRWRQAGLVHLGPVAGECSPALASLFPTAFLGLTPQGWMRRWDDAGLVRPGPWEGADPLLARADAVVVSEEDVQGDLALARRWAAQTRVLAVTRGRAGCTVFAGGMARDLPGWEVEEVDPTGAGDVFAAVLFARLRAGDTPWAAARAANCLAARSVTRRGIEGTPTPEEITRCLVGPH